MRISNFSESDVGVYTCIASNVMGRANSTIRLYGKFLRDGFSLPLLKTLWTERLYSDERRLLRQIVSWLNDSICL